MRVGALFRGGGEHTSSGTPPATRISAPLRSRPVPETLQRMPLPPRLADAAATMAPAYLRRRLARTGSPYRWGDTTTFVYVGDAETVRVVHFMSCFPAIPPLERIDGTEVWFVTVELPRGSRVEYRYEVTSSDRTVLIDDPLNRQTAADPFGVNSVATAPGYSAPVWTAPNVDRVPGQVETVEIESSAFGDARTFSAYLPAGYPNEAPYPAVVLHDGSDLLEYASLATVFDNLIGEGVVRPFIGLLLDPVVRNREYMAAVDHGRFVVEDVLPYAEAELNISTDPSDRVIGGASLGAVASLATAWRHPGTFSSLVLLSGTFVTATGGRWERSEELQPVVEFMTEFSGDPGASADRAWMACGAYEALAADNRVFVPVLEGSGMRVCYGEPKDGHHWISWSDGIGAALQDLLAPISDGTNG